LRELRELSRIKPELRAVFNSWKLAEFAEKVRAKAESGKAGTGAGFSANCANYRELNPNSGGF
jgi:hypothetical protein